MKTVPKPSHRSTSKAKKKQARRVREAQRAKAIGATPERMGLNGGIITDHIAISPKTVDTVPRHRAACECQLDAYRMQGKIDESQFRGGMQFREAWLISSEGIKTSDSIMRDRIDNGKAMTAEDVEEQETWARRIINEAFEELPPGQIHLVINVCGYDQFVGTEYDIRVFRRGLDKLARLWHL